MNHRYSLLFVLVDATLWRESAQPLTHGGDVSLPARNSGAEFPAMGVSGETACMLVHAGDLKRIDSKLEEWVLATAMRFAEMKERYSQLTPRERQALPLITDGMLNKQAASVLGISPATLQLHRGRIMQKMGARSLADLVRIADVLGVSSGHGGNASARESTRPPPASTPAIRVGGESAA